MLWRVTYQQDNTSCNKLIDVQLDTNFEDSAYAFMLVVKGHGGCHVSVILRIHLKTMLLLMFVKFLVNNVLLLYETRKV